MKRSRARVYDNGGKTFDRYTFVFPSLDVPHNNDYYGSSKNPFYPQGFGQSAGNYPYPDNHNYRHLGKLISPNELPEQARKFFEQIKREYEKALTLPSTEVQGFSCALTEGRMNGYFKENEEWAEVWKNNIDELRFGKDENVQ